MVDWSAASRPGPPRETKDQIWLAWGTALRRFPPRYCRTREEAFETLAELLAGRRGPALVGFDFPNAYPAGSGLGGGRETAQRLAALVEDAPDNRNNRFEVARRLNRELGKLPGPFWMCPAKAADHALTVVRPSFEGRGFCEYRLVERRLRARGKYPHSVWKLGGAGSVGSQALMGLPVVHRLLNLPSLAPNSRIWPFETGWDAALDGIVHAEIWPSLFRCDDQPYTIKDARQVAAVRDALLAADRDGCLRALFARPGGLSERENDMCLAEEGWILGVA
ncbi:MAG TPA: hypothetical protein VJ487_05725 [Alphaproteobacteria bacterium]|nr:hypothetical protein [Alphaproteobacteria bacterium]